MASKKVLFTRPQHDDVTNYLSSWCEEVIIFAHDNNIQVKDLGAENVTRENFEKFIVGQDPKLVIINGHGEEDCIFGHKNEVLVKKGVNDNILRGRIVYAVSCDSAYELGPSAVDKGAIAYIGYDSPFGFLTNKNKECTPEDDELANNFKEPSNVVPLSLLKGNSVGASYEKSQNRFKDLIKKFTNSHTLLEAKDIRFWLFWDMKAQKLLGSPESNF